MPFQSRSYRRERAGEDIRKDDSAEDIASPSRQRGQFTGGGLDLVDIAVFFAEGAVAEEGGEGEVEEGGEGLEGGVVGVGEAGAVEAAKDAC